MKRCHRHLPWPWHQQQHQQQQQQQSQKDCLLVQAVLLSKVLCLSLPPTLSPLPLSSPPPCLAPPAMAWTQYCRTAPCPTWQLVIGCCSPAWARTPRLPPPPSTGSPALQPCLCSRASRRSGALPVLAWLLGRQSLLVLVLLLLLWPSHLLQLHLGPRKVERGRRNRRLVRQMATIAACVPLVLSRLLLQPLLLRGSVKGISTWRATACWAAALAATGARGALAGAVAPTVPIVRARPAVEATGTAAAASQSSGRRCRVEDEKIAERLLVLIWMAVHLPRAFVYRATRA